MLARVSLFTTCAFATLMSTGCDPAAEPTSSVVDETGCAEGKCDGADGPSICYTQQATIYTSKTRCIQARGKLQPGEPVALRIAEADTHGEAADCDAAFSGRDDRWSLIFDEVLEHETVEVEGRAEQIWRYGTPRLRTIVDSTVDWALLRVGEDLGAPSIEVVFDTGRFTSPVAPIFTPIWWPLLIQMTPPELSSCAPEGVTPVPSEVEVCELVERAPVLSGEASMEHPLALPPFEIDAGRRMVAHLNSTLESGNGAVLRITRWTGDRWVQEARTSTDASGSAGLNERVFESGLYRVEALPERGDVVSVRLSFDVVSSGCNERFLCFGAEGPGCTECSPVSDGRVECSVSVGSQMHDSCCADHPGGVGCARDEGELCPHPQARGKTIECCELEYEKMRRDAEHESIRIMDPVRVTHHPATLARTISLPDGGISSIPEPPAPGRPGAMLARPGDTLQLEDAQLGWCGAGRYESQGATATCTD